MNQRESDPGILQTLATCADPVEADLLKIALEASGIDAVINGGELHTALGYIGSALGQISVLVRKECLADAQGVYNEWKKDRDRIREQPPWFCGQCNVDIEGHFLACWSCGMDRLEVEAAFPATANRIEDGFDNPISTAGESDPTDPWASPRAKPLGVERGHLDEDQQQQYITRMFALPAIVFSCFSILFPALPVLFAIFAFNMATSRKEKLSTTNLWLLCLSLVISLIGTVWWIYRLQVIT